MKQRQRKPSPGQVDQFIVDTIDSVPHLEALLLLWEHRPEPWSTEDIAARLFVAPRNAQSILSNLTARDLLAVLPDPPERYHYLASPVRDPLIAAIAVTYRRELVRISKLIHTKASEPNCRRAHSQCEG